MPDHQLAPHTEQHSASLEASLQTRQAADGVGAPDVDWEALRDSAGQASALLKGLANPDRLILMCQLSAAECCVSDLEARTGIQQPSLSQQLTVLRSLGLVETRRDGKYVYYRIASDAARDVMAVLFTHFCGRQTG